MNEMRKAVASQTHKKKKTVLEQNLAAANCRRKSPETQINACRSSTVPSPLGTEKPWCKLVVDIEVRKWQEAHKEQSIDTRGERVLKGPLQPAVI